VKRVLLLLAILFLGSFLLCTSAKAYLLVTDIDTIDTAESLTDLNPAYWTGSDVNPLTFTADGGVGTNQLKNSGDDTVIGWLKALLGKTDAPDPSVVLLGEIVAGTGGLGISDHSISNFNPGFSWDYAVVKYGKYYNAFGDEFGNDLLTTPEFAKGISHIRFYGPDTNPVPEPTTMLLLGFGLIGLATFGRKRFVKGV
jgi:PEP-CTERM motif